MIKKIIVILKRVRKAMPKFYHDEACGVTYSARAVGFWRRFPFRFLPYLTGDVIWIHLKLKQEDNCYPEAILRIEPPIMSDEPGWEGGPLVPLSSYAFTFERVGKRTDAGWSGNIPLKGGISFGQPCDIECYVDLQEIKDNKVERCSLHIADIEIVSRGPFLTNIWMWVIGLIGAGVIGGGFGYLIAVSTRNGQTP